MLSRLVKWLKHCFQRLFGSKNVRFNQSAAAKTAIPSPPALTNADLEFLFTQLLEGVQQARGQQWALSYLQRIEHRVNNQRWLEWLQFFGDRLLGSPVPNDELAFRMVQLGELEIGVVGDSALEIGMRLLTRNSEAAYWQDVTTTDVDSSAAMLPFPEDDRAEDVYTNHDSESNDSSVEEIPATVENSPGQELLREYGEALWGSEVREASVDDGFQSGVDYIEFVNPEIAATDLDYALETPGHNLIREYGEELWVAGDVIEDDELQEVGEFQPAITEISAAPKLEELGSDVEVINDLGELAWQDQVEIATPPPTPAAVNWDKLLQRSGEAATLVSLDELWIRLQHSGSLVERLTSIPVNNTAQVFIDAPPHPSAIGRAQAWFYQALKQAKFGDLNGAIASYDTAISITPDAYEYWFNRGLALFHLGYIKEAIASYEKSIVVKPDYYKAWLNRAVILAEQGRYDDAIASFDKVIEIHPEANEAWSGRSLALLKLGKIPEAIYSYDQTTRLQPYDPENWYHRGVALAENQQYAEAVTSFDEAIEIQPEQSIIWHQRGLSQLHLQRWEDAVISFQKALKSQPGNHELWYLRGNALEKSGQYQQAIASYDNALELNPSLHAVWIDRGVIQAHLQQWYEAIVSWNKALEIEPNLYLAWFNQAIAWEKLGETQEAIASYDCALNIEPNFHTAWYNRGVLLASQGELEAAILSYDYALQIQSDYWEAWLARANTAAKSTTFDSYLASYSAIVAENPYLNSRGLDGKLATYAESVYYVNSNTYPEGIGRLYLGLGDSYYQRGRRYSFIHDDWSKAIESYNKALETLTPESFPELNLEVLQSIIVVLLGFGDVKQAQQFHICANNLLQTLINQPHRSDREKRDLHLRFIGLGQLAVDVAAQSGDLVEALEFAEYSRNQCWELMLWDSNQPISTPQYHSIQKLLNPKTAIAYWFITPCGLRSFVIKFSHPEPILVFTPVFNVEGANEYPVPEVVERLVSLEDWITEWDFHHQQLTDTPNYQESFNQHSWYAGMEQRLVNLREILNISAIEHELEGIEQLILIPHRDLCRFPIHALFQIQSPQETENSEFQVTCPISYLPNVDIGLSLLNQSSLITNKQSLVSIEPAAIPANLELEIIPKIFNNCQRIPGNQAVKYTCKSALANNLNIYHFTGETINYLNHPQASQLILGEENLNLAEICQNSLANCQLFILSGSQNLINENKFIPTEYIDVANVLLTIGVSHVLCYQWHPEPNATALIIIEFYRRLQAGKTPSIALDEATKWLKELTISELKQWYQLLLDPISSRETKTKYSYAHVTSQLDKNHNLPPDSKLYSHPYYWATFKISGSWN
ncbi:Tetratricopeptide TPR_2 repeat-containing protein [Calothrix sp. PCC 6303]|nr:Tetratricopeptide TPR_2 repeat-containing protein [Calothrix sp. PCC 6303]